MVLNLVLPLLGFILAFAVRVGVTHGIANLFVYQHQKIQKAVKIYVVELGLNFILGVGIVMIFYAFRIVSPGIASLLVILGGFLGTIAIIWAMIKYTAKTYDTHLLEGAIIYILAMVVAGLIVGGGQILLSAI